MLSQRGCEHCHLGQCPTYGLPCEWRRRWCAACAKAHAGARDLTSKLCEDCGLKQSSFGIPCEGRQRRRWCAACAKVHAGARDLTSKLCEDCGLKQPSCAHPADGLRRRWCSACATAHEGARSVTTSKRRMLTASVAGDPPPVTAPKAWPGPNGDCPRRTRVWTLLPPPAPVHEPLAVSAAQEPCAKRVCAPSPLGAALMAQAASFSSKPSRTTATMSWAHSLVSLSNPATGRLQWDSLVLMCCSWETCLAC